MSKSKIVAMMVLVIFAMGIFLVGDALAGERGKVANREVSNHTPVHTLKVPDVEGHTIYLMEAKGIVFTEKWGACLLYGTYTLDLIKGEGTGQGYTHYTFPDGSTLDFKWEGRIKGGGRGTTGSASAEAPWTYIKGTGKFEGIQGGGTFKSYTVGPGQVYVDIEGAYTLP
jgi:hypothetical protein